MIRLPDGRSVGVYLGVEIDCKYVITLEADSLSLILCVAQLGLHIQSFWACLSRTMHFL